jgi:hypothetical protein
MKKNGKCYKRLKGIWISLMLKQGFIVCLLLVILSGQTTFVNAQTRKVTISMKNTEIVEVLKEIQIQTGLTYLLNHEEIQDNVKVTVQVENANVEEALDQCFRNLNLTYKIVDNVIIVTPKKKKEETDEGIKTQFVQSVKGNITDRESGEPLIGATIIIKGTDPVKGNSTDEKGNFKIGNVPIGRYNIEIRYVGYEPFLVREILVSSGKEVVLNIGLKESVAKLDEIKITPNTNKERPINSMATLSAQQVSVEEANRYAGGFDDPARLVASYAGVASTVSNNGIVIRGNAPKGLLWRMEGIQIPNPNHFADYYSLGGGVVTALSSQTMSNSDFYTGAFPAEYGNALSGVFDIKMRTGNTEKREQTFQAGAIGIDYAAEGPFVKGKNSSYLFNYRYSTLGLISPALPKKIGRISYQDLSFKLNFPTEKMGVFSLWGIGAIDSRFRGYTRSDTSENNAKLLLGAIGLSHKIIFNDKISMNTTFAPTGNSAVWYENTFNENMVSHPFNKVSDYRWKYTFTSYVNYKFSPKHTNRTGFIVDRLNYNIDIQIARNAGEPVQTYVSSKKASSLFQFFSQSKVDLNDHLTMNLGIHSQYFALNNKYTVEPRLGIRWNFKPTQTLSFAYGLHSQLEDMNLYLVELNTSNGKIMPNKNLDFDKAHHFVLGYEIRLSDNVVFKVEPFYQKLYNIPVVPDSYTSTINMTHSYDFDDSLVNIGTGENIGLDLTLERFLNKGYYYMVTASFFNSTFKGGNGIEKNTRYNKNYVFNLLVGKEWFIGDNKNNVFGANIKMTYMGGDRITPVNIAETMAQQEIVEDVTRSFSKKTNDSPILSLAISYRKNKLNYSSIFSFSVINALAHEEFGDYNFNKTSQTIEESKDLFIVPNLSYKIEF